MKAEIAQISSAAPWRTALVLILGSIVLARGASAQIGRHDPPESGPTSPFMTEAGSIVVNVHGPGGVSLETLAIINVYTQYRQLYKTGSAGNGNLRYDGVPLGIYIIEATAPGYITSEENVELMERNDQQHVSFMLRPLGDPSARPVANKPALLAPKAQKELNQGLEQIRANNTTEAKKHLANAEKLAPNNPDVHYLLGVLASQGGDRAGARAYWEKAVSEFPAHTLSLVALGEAHLSQGEGKEAKDLLEKAVAADPSSWRAHELLGRAHLQNRDFENSAQEAEKAIALGKAQASVSQLVLAKALIGQGKTEKAANVLKEFLDTKPVGPVAASALKLSDALAKAEAERIAEAARAENVPAPPPLPPPVKWMPPDVDGTVPPVGNGVACSLDEILPKVGKNVIKFTKGLDRFTATEHMQHQVVSDQGIAVRNDNLRFNYLVSMNEIRPGILNVDEYRNGTTALDVFPDGIATKGLPSMILIFHPVHQDDFEMKCEGLGSWRGIPAWQVHFQQKEDHMGRSRTYRINGALYPIALKGRAWISRDLLQVIRVETDLVKPIPEIRLLAEHQEIDYGAVPFPKQHAEYWLPATTDFYTEFRGRRIHRRLSYSDYVLFSVEERQKIGAPEQKKETN
jgi:Flp pilus assembly protein TadD